MLIIVSVQWLWWNTIISKSFFAVFVFIKPDEHDNKLEEEDEEPDERTEEENRSKEEEVC